MLGWSPMIPQLAVRLFRIPCCPSVAWCSPSDAARGRIPLSCSPQLACDSQVPEAHYSTPEDCHSLAGRLGQPQPRFVTRVRQPVGEVAAEVMNLGNSWRPAAVSGRLLGSSSGSTPHAHRRIRFIRERQLDRVNAGIILAPGSFPKLLSTES
jgi:hypothetical protein